MASLYIQDILLPDEVVRHHAKVHYVLYAPGVLCLLVAVALMYYVPTVVTYMDMTYDTKSKVMGFTKFLSASFFMGGAALILKAWLQIYSTEVVITNERILVKIGVSTATTAEIDRHRISSVVVHKSFMGRLLNYGWVHIRGYSGNITGLPALANPHEIQKHIYAK